MDINKEIKILRERNKMLFDELNHTKKIYNELKHRCGDIENIYFEFNSCIKELKEQRDIYSTLNQELYNLKEALIKKGFSENGFRMPIYKILLIRLKKTKSKLLGRIRSLFFGGGVDK